MSRHKWRETPLQSRRAFALWTVQETLTTLLDHPNSVYWILITGVSCGLTRTTETPRYAEGLIKSFLAYSAMQRHLLNQQH